MFGQLGLIWKYNDKRQTYGWRFHSTKAETKHTMGVEVLGTGVSFALGKNIAPFDYMADALGYADVRFGKSDHTDMRYDSYQRKRVNKTHR
ncbi:MAG: hypothetical protein AAF429_10055 [Pseudomonadota bacterium]